MDRSCLLRVMSIRSWVMPAFGRDDQHDNRWTLRTQAHQLNFEIFGKDLLALQ
jgi:hypothetical protein